MGRLLRMVLPAATLLAALGLLRAEEGSAVPAHTLRVVGRARTGSQPKAVTLSPDGRTLVVTNFGQRWARNLSFYDAGTLERTAELDVPDSNLVESIWASDGTRLYVSDFTNHRVLFIDPATREVVGEAAVDHHPKVLALSPDGSRLYASCWGDGTVVAVDAGSGERLGSVEVGRHPRGMAVSPDGGRLWVVDYGSDDLQEIDTASLAVVRRLAFAERSYPRHVVRNGAGDRLYVSAKNRNVVYVVDTGSLELLNEIAVGDCPKTIVLSPDERLLYAADYCSDDVTVVDLETLASRAVPVEGLREASGLAIDASGGRLWVTGWSSKDVFALEPDDEGAP